MEPITGGSVNSQYSLLQHDSTVVEDAHVPHAPHGPDVEESWGGGGYHAEYIAKISEQTIDLTCLRVDIDVQVARCSRKARNGLDIGSESV